MFLEVYSTEFKRHEVGTIQLNWGHCLKGLPVSWRRFPYNRLDAQYSLFLASSAAVSYTPHIRAGAHF